MAWRTDRMDYDDRNKLTVIDHTRNLLSLSRSFAIISACLTAITETKPVMEA